MSYGTWSAHCHYCPGERCTAVNRQPPSVQCPPLPPRWVCAPVSWLFWLGFAVCAFLLRPSCLGLAVCRLGPHLSWPRCVVSVSRPCPPLPAGGVVCVLGLRRSCFGFVVHVPFPRPPAGVCVVCPSSPPFVVGWLLGACVACVLSLLALPASPLCVLDARFAPRASPPPASASRAPPLSLSPLARRAAPWLAALRPTCPPCSSALWCSGVAAPGAICAWHLVVRRGCGRRRALWPRIFALRLVRSRRSRFAGRHRGRERRGKRTQATKPRRSKAPTTPEGSRTPPESLPEVEGSVGVSVCVWHGPGNRRGDPSTVIPQFGSRSSELCPVACERRRRSRNRRIQQH